MLTINLPAQVLLHSDLGLAQANFCLFFLPSHGRIGECVKLGSMMVVIIALTIFSVEIR